MDNQNNNYENINRIPREPDFPPKPCEYVAPEQNLNEEDTPIENTAENSQKNRTAFNESNSKNYQNDDDLGIPNIPPQSFQNSYNPPSFQNQQPYENYQPFNQFNAGVNYPNVTNTPVQNYNPNVQNQYNQYPQQVYPQPYRQGYQPYVNPQQTRQVVNQNLNPYSNPYINPSNPANPMMNSAPQKSSTGLKVFLICLLIVFGICLIGFVATVSYSMGQSAGSGHTISINPTDNYDYNEPDIQKEEEDKEHPESDYSDKINPDYKGLKLNSPVSDKDNSKYSSEYTYNAVSPSVVGIICYYGDIEDESSYATQASGIIISKDGYIVTNSHVINNSKTEYALKVVTSDGKEYTAGVVGYDARTDIALLKADATDLKPATFGKSEDMSIGSSVVAIGNPGGINYQNSITSGVISALNRTVSSNTTVKYIQSDAATNPGNSGGPLCNLYGQIIGMNTSKIVSESYEGMGFAIPSETIKEIVDDLMKNGYVTGRVKMGIIGVAVSAQDQIMYDLPSGIMVDSVDADGPLKDSGIQQEDIITKVDGESISTFGDVYEVLAKHKPGDKIKIEVYRHNYYTGKGETFEVEVTLIEDKAE